MFLLLRAAISSITLAPLKYSPVLGVVADNCSYSTAFHW
jgi:hypothetical protein